MQSIKTICEQIIIWNIGELGEEYCYKFQENWIRSDYF